jgi:3'-phosphoadenosine 5'-phosphosulfate sulfotransferase (PAPS reductase)/FAD synthetase
MRDETKIELAQYSAVVVSISGGKDSQTILGVVMDRVREQSYGGQVIAVHADTGAEWPQSLPHCRMLCEHYGIELRVAMPFRALPAHIERRCKMLAEQGRAGGWPDMANRYCTSHCKVNAIQKVVRAGWPSSQCRYCTSDCKRDPIQKVVRHTWPAELKGTSILSVTGERRQESSHRAKLPFLETNKPLTAGGRKVTNWRPILGYKTEDVWAHIAATGLPRHVAYDRGNERLSCAICVLATDNDIRNGAEACPELAEHYLRIERETGHTFRYKKSLAAILGRETTTAA